MRIIFTTNQIIGSTLIRWVTGQPASHVAFVFDDKVVIHSSLFGIDLKWFKTYQKHNKIIEEIVIPLRSSSEEKVWQTLMDQHDETQYDFGAVVYQALFRILGLIGIKLPMVNIWADRNHDMCVEVYGTLSKIINLPKIENLEMMSAYDLFLALKKAQVSGE